MRRVGIRREDKDPWEARVPLIPDDVARLTGSGAAEIVVQPSPRRVFTEDEYVRAGARVDEDLGACDIVLAVKEIPRELFRRGATYAFFSHTIKGQPYNMDMLRRLMELECQLIDYERITDHRGRRLIFFSRFAGLAGAIDSLWTLGRRLEWEGLAPNPFAALEQTHRYPTLEAALEAVRDVGERIAADGLPAELCPFVIGITGYGNVSLGAQEVVDALGAIAVSPDRLDELCAGGGVAVSPPAGSPAMTATPPTRSCSPSGTSWRGVTPQGPSRWMSTSGSRSCTKAPSRAACRSSRCSSTACSGTRRTPGW